MTKRWRVMLFAAATAFSLAFLPSVDAKATTTINDSDVGPAIRTAVTAGETDIVISAGAHTCSGANLTGFTSGLKITATGATITGTSSNPILFTQSGTNHSNLTIEGGTWNGNSAMPAVRLYNISGLTVNNATFAGGDTSFRVATGSNITLNTVAISGMSNYGANFDTVTGLTIKNTSFNSNGSIGLRVVSSSNVTLETVTASSNKANGVNIASTTGLTVNGLTAESNTTNGLNLESVTGTLSLSGVKSNKNSNMGARLYSCSTATIDNLVATGNGKIGLYLESTTGSTVKDATISGNDSYGIELTSASNTTISGGSSKANGDHNLCILSKTTGIKATGTDFSSSTGGYGIYLEKASQIALTSCTVNDNYFSGVAITGSGSSLEVTEGTVNGNGKRPNSLKIDGKKIASDYRCAGIGVYDGATATIKGTALNNNRGCGIAPNGKKSSKVTVKVYGCTMDNNGDHGIGARPYATVTVGMLGTTPTTTSNNTHHGVMLNDHCTGTVEGLISYGNGKAGIDVVTSSTLKKLTNCQLYNNGSKSSEDGVHIGDKSKMNDMTGCTVYNNAGSGIGIYKKSTVTVGASNKIYSNKKYGIVADKSTFTGNMKKSTVEKNKDTGIMLRNSAKATLSNVTTQKNKKHGICVQGKATATIKSVTTKSNKVDGLRIQDSGTTVTVKKLTSTENTQNGMVVQNGATVKNITGSKIQKNKKNGVGVYSRSSIKKASGNTIKKNKVSQVYVESGCSSALKKKK